MMADSLRSAVERRSAPIVVRLRALPAPALLIAVVALVVAGLLMHGALSALPLAAVGLLVSWLTYLAWPALSANARSVRVLLLVLVLAMVVARAAGR